jgi:hypothetical protein
MQQVQYNQPNQTYMHHQYEIPGQRVSVGNASAQSWYGSPVAYMNAPTQPQQYMPSEGNNHHARASGASTPDSRSALLPKAAPVAGGSLYSGGRASSDERERLDEVSLEDEYVENVESDNLLGASTGGFSSTGSAISHGTSNQTQSPILVEKSDVLSSPREMAMSMSDMQSVGSGGYGTLLKEYEGDRDGDDQRTGIARRANSEVSVATVRTFIRDPYAMHELEENEPLEG